jgi:tetratricopeptide (TPR) repeat protein
MVEEAISFWTEIQRFEDMLAADPRSLSFAPLAELYRKLGLLDDAISVAKKGCALHPDYPGGFFALGAACFDKGLTDEARPALERVVLLSPENLRAQKLLGQLYVDAGESALARRALEQVLRQNPDDAESALLLHSIASTIEEAASEEEFLEEAELIEDLTEVFEDPQEHESAAPLAAALPEFTEFSEFPDVTEVPDLPEFAAFPEVSEFSELSGTPEFAEFSEFTEISGAPELAEASEAPELPDFSGFSEFSEVPEVPEVWTVPAVPEPLLQHPSRDPLTTATLAELYVSQGFLGKAITIYQELLAADPANNPYRLRSSELKAVRERQRTGEPVAAPQPLKIDAAQQAAPASGASADADADADADAELSRWLENIRRRRDGV